MWACSLGDTCTSCLGELLAACIGDSDTLELMGIMAAAGLWCGDTATTCPGDATPT